MLWIKLFWLYAAILPFSFALNPAESVDLPLARILVPIVFIFWLSWSLATKKIAIDQRARFWLFVIFLFLALISFFWSIDQFRAVRKILFLLSFFPIYFVSFSALQKDQQRQTFAKILAWSSFSVAVFALALFFFQFAGGIDSALEIASRYVATIFLGNTFSDIVAAFPSWLVNVKGMTLMRTFGTFPDPHLFSLYINLVLPFVFYLYLKEKKKVYLAISAVLLVASLLAFSRAAYISLIGGALFFLAFSHPIALARKYFISSLLVLIALFYLIAIPNPLIQRMQASFDISEGSNRGRIAMWQKGFETIKEDPWKGVGIGNFSRHIEPTSSYRDPIYAHNLFLDFGSEIGILGAMILFFVLLSPIVDFIKKPSLEKKIIATIFVVFIIHSMFETPLFSVRVFPLMLILLSMKTDD